MPKERVSNLDILLLNLTALVLQFIKIFLQKFVSIFLHLRYLHRTSVSIKCSMLQDLSKT